MHRVNVLYRFVNQSLTIPQVGFVMNTKEHTKILEACHKDPTSGHMGTETTLAHVTSCGLEQQTMQNIL